MERSRDARFEDLYRRHVAAIAAYALRRVSREAAEDVVAETFLVAWRRLEEVPEPALPWLFGVARGTLANHHRSSRRREALAERLRVELGEVTVAPVEKRLLEGLLTLSIDDRELLLLTSWEGLSAGEAAEVLGCSAVACRIRLHRARKRLAAALDSLPYAAELHAKEAS